jgi:hypothetical protein
MDLDALAALAGNTLVTAAVTDGFETVRHKVARLFGRGKPEAGVERRLEATRQQLTTAAAGELANVRAAQAGQWQTRFADLLADHPEVAAELSVIVAELQSVVPDASGAVRHIITGSVVHGPVLMGRDFGNVTIDSAPHPPPKP